MISNTPSLALYTDIVRREKGNTQVCTFLLDQSNLSGVGNYLKSEILYHAAIHPSRTVVSLTDDEVEALYIHTVRVMAASLKAGGYTMSDYLSPDGSTGGYQPSVYGKSYTSDNRVVVKEVFQDRRATYWVPGVQV
jgi:formamidopyrimidine-DNA glycosylase